MAVVPSNVETINLGRVRGFDGVSPVVAVQTDTQSEYKLKVTTRNDDGGITTIITPNLKGTPHRIVRLEVANQFNPCAVVPMSDLGLDASRSYMFVVVPEVPPNIADGYIFKSAMAKRVGNTLEVYMYYDTLPYTTVSEGSPLTGGTMPIGGFNIGEFTVGSTFGEGVYPLLLMAFENDAIIHT